MPFAQALGEALFIALFALRYLVGAAFLGTMIAAALVVYFVPCFLQAWTVTWLLLLLLRGRHWFLRPFAWTIGLCLSTFGALALEGPWLLKLTKTSADRTWLLVPFLGLPCAFLFVMALLRIAMAWRVMAPAASRPTGWLRLGRLAVARLLVLFGGWLVYWPALAGGLLAWFFHVFPSLPHDPQAPLPALPPLGSALVPVGAIAAIALAAATGLWWIARPGGCLRGAEEPALAPSPANGVQ